MPPRLVPGALPLLLQHSWASCCHDVITEGDRERGPGLSGCYSSPLCVSLR